jgi:hypothetical protein
MEVLAPDHQRLVGALEAGGAGAGELAGRPSLEPVPAKAEGVRSKATRPVERGWWAEERPGVFTSRRSAG